jgi:hypothetical protein
MATCGPEVFGANPANIQWQVVRGDTSPLRIEFLEDDEVTYYDISSWSFAATTYDIKGDVLDELEVVVGNGYVDIKASPDITQYWGSGYKAIVGELIFDLEVSIGETVWTPVIGTIHVIGDVSGTL